MEFLSAAQSKASLTGWHGELFVSCYELASVRAGNHTDQICLSSNRTEQCSEGACWAALGLSPTSYPGSLGLRPFAEESRVFWDTLGHPACPAIASQEDGVCQQPCVTPSTLVEVTQSHCCLCNGSTWLVFSNWLKTLTEASTFKRIRLYELTPTPHFHVSLKPGER